MDEISDLYAEYKTGTITKGQYDYRRARAIRQFRQNLGPMEKLLFGDKTARQSLRNPGTVYLVPIHALSGNPGTVYEIRRQYT